MVRSLPALCARPSVCRGRARGRGVLIAAGRCTQPPQHRQTGGAGYVLCWQRASRATALCRRTHRSLCAPLSALRLLSCLQAHISMGDIDLLHPPKELELRRHKLKRLVPSPNSFFMDVKCPGCFNMCARPSLAPPRRACGAPRLRPRAPSSPTPPWPEALAPTCGGGVRPDHPPLTQSATIDR